MAYKKGITKLVSSRKSSSKAVKRKTTKSTKSTKFPLIKPGQESVGAEEGSESSSTYDNSNQDQHDSCLDANWVNMPLGVSWNTQKVDYCNRAKIISPFYVDIIGSHWFAQVCPVLAHRSELFEGSVAAHQPCSHALHIARMISEVS